MGLENARVENDGRILRGLENAGLENDGQKLAGTRVSVLSVLTLWPLCQMAVRCVVHLLTLLCLCILMCIWRTIVRHFSN